MARMTWEMVEPIWKICFAEAWEAYRHRSVPIGAVITDAAGEIIARGRNRINDTTAPQGQLHATQLAHAEMNVLLQLNRSVHDVHACTLWTTMEPCPLCFGAMYMSGVRSLRFAARDHYAGSTNLYGATEYMKRKPLAIRGPEPQLELLQMVIKTENLLRYVPGKGTEMLLAQFALDCPDGVEIGRRWYAQGVLLEAQESNTPIEVIADQVWSQSELLHV